MDGISPLVVTSEPRPGSLVTAMVDGTMMEIQVQPKRICSPRCSATMVIVLSAVYMLSFIGLLVMWIVLGTPWWNIVIVVSCAILGYLNFRGMFLNLYARNTLRIDEHRYEHDPCATFTTCGRNNAFMNILFMVPRFPVVGPTADLKEAALSTDSSSAAAQDGHVLKLERNNNNSYPILPALTDHYDKIWVKDIINSHLQLLASTRQPDNRGVYARQAPNPPSMHYDENEALKATITSAHVGLQDEHVTINMPLATGPRSS